MDLKEYHPFSTRVRYSIAIGSIILATVVRALLDPLLSAQIIYAVYLVAIMAVAWFSGFWPSILALFLGWEAAQFFFVAPRHVLRLPDLSTQLQVGTAGYVGLGLAMIVVCCAMRAAQRRATARAELLRVTLASIGDAVIATDAKGKIQFINAAAATLAGWTQRDAIGQPIENVFRVVDEQTRQPVENPALRSLRAGTLVATESHGLLTTPEGPPRPVDDSAAPIRDTLGRLVGCVLIFRDMSERRRAESDLRASEARKSSMLRASLDAIITIDGNGIVVEFNPAAEALFGYSAAEAVGADMGSLIIPEHLLARHRAGIVRCLETGDGPVLNRRLEMPARRKNGSLITVELSIVPVAGVRPLFTGFLRDVTAQKRSVDAIRASEERFRSLVSATTSIVWTSDEAGRFVVPQPSWSDYTGQTWEELKDWHWINAIHPDDREQTWEAGKAARRIRRMLKIDGRLWHAASNTYRHFEARGVPVYDGDGTVREWVGMCIDMEEQRLAAGQLAHAVAELQEADQRKDEFLATLAHELRGPLAPLRNVLEIMKRADDDPEVRMRARMTMERQLVQVVRLIDDLLDVSRIGRGRIELRRSRIELGEVIHQAVEAARPGLEAANQQFSLTLEPGPITVDADPARLAQVIGNLLNNACKYTEFGGSIALSAERRGDEAVISVRDTGIGIPPDRLTAIFDLYHQSDHSIERSQGGLGIGLTLVKRLVEMHGGTVEAFSEGPRRGSEFVIHLPIFTGTQAEPPLAAPSATATATARRFLVVDDNRDSASSLAMLLSLSGNETRVAHDGLEAVDAAESFRPDVILLDIGLPKLNGHEAARRILAEPWSDGMVLIALSGWGQDDDRRKSAEAGFRHHLVKPVEYTELTRLIAALPSRNEHPDGQRTQ